MVSIWSVVIIFFPYLLYVYNYIPATKVWETPFFTITAHGYTSVQVYLWLAIDRALQVIIFSMVFLLMPKPWNHAWLSLIFFNLFRFFGVVNLNTDWVDEWEIVHTIPFAVIITVILYTLKRKLQTRLQILHLHEDVEEALTKLKS